MVAGIGKKRLTSAQGRLSVAEGRGRSSRCHQGPAQSRENILLAEMLIFVQADKGMRKLKWCLKQSKDQVART